MTAVAAAFGGPVGASRGVPRRHAASSAEAHGRLEPEPVIAALLLVLVVLLLAHKPLARAIGTEVDTDPAITPIAVPPAIATPTTITAPKAVATPPMVGPTHAPVNPFQPLLSAKGAARSRAALVGGALGAAAGAQQSKADHASASSTAGSGRNTHSATSTTTTNCASSYVVRSGDSLWSIAAGHHVTGGWKQLYDANEQRVGSDPGLLRIGMQLCLPRH